MEPHRWREIDDIFAAALELDSAERPAFLAHACGEDQLLRIEVESLLAHGNAHSVGHGHIRRSLVGKLLHRLLRQVGAEDK